jgi:hypothetical protein
LRAEEAQVKYHELEVQFCGQLSKQQLSYEAGAKTNRSRDSSSTEAADMTLMASPPMDLPDNNMMIEETSANFYVHLWYY